ncbi:hypothetical protein GCM10028771_36870 [Nocardioides marmoraquaticus]
MSQIRSSAPGDEAGKSIHIVGTQARGQYTPEQEQELLDARHAMEMAQIRASTTVVVCVRWAVVGTCVAALMTYLAALWLLMTVDPSVAAPLLYAATGGAAAVGGGVAWLRRRSGGSN